MISGIVNDKYATITLTFILPNGSTIPIGFVIDTGFTGHLCLPQEAVSLLGFPCLYDLPANLADNNASIVSCRGTLVL